MNRPQKISLRTPQGIWLALRYVVVHRILGLDDTPHRIAFGVFLGFVVGATPTIGLQMAMYVVIAAILGANKISGIPPIWLSNPITAVPLFYGEWKVGQLLMRGEFSSSPETKQALAKLLDAPGQELNLFQRLLSSEFWGAAIDAFIAMGVELWVGSLFCGTVVGALAYWLTYRGVVAFRRRRHAS